MKFHIFSTKKKKKRQTNFATSLKGKVRLKYYLFLQLLVLLLSIKNVNKQGISETLLFHLSSIFPILVAYRYFPQQGKYFFVLWGIFLSELLIFGIGKINQVETFIIDGILLAIPSFIAAFAVLELQKDL